MQNYLPGQRWISDAELQMGLGTVLSSDQRTVTVVFLATGETRLYATATAPLRRALFALGDSVLSHEGWQLRIESVREDNGLITYFGKRDDGSAAELAEGHLDSFIQLNRPSERLLSGQIDANKRFELRCRTLQYANRLGHSELRGLTGVRTSLIPHQLYIAHEVAGRYAPRVLLADEVGLGKTIEAGMIIHQQLLSELAQRVLIVVPESLVHQWLVEMLRRFNLHFSIFNEDRCHAIDDADENPFESEQLALCSLDFLSSDPKRYKQLQTAGWDLLVVDEAHHLQWSEEEPSLEYELIERLAAQIKGVLLLTATPEQLGKAGHFARLRLLDPNRFPDFETFVEEEKHYEPIAQAVEELLGDQPISAAAHAILESTFSEGDNAELLLKLSDSNASEQHQGDARRALVEHLLDRHGTGRVLFRNTRSAIKGFPGRQLHTYALPLPQQYGDCLRAFQGSAIGEPQLLLSPELLYQAASDNTPRWTEIDPRVKWLGDLLKQLRPAKVLVITASADTAMDLSETLMIKTGIHAAVFHEEMSIIERDRAAAYFADQDFGTQVLICSEIGSEGRNFQFAHHLVLFDLPLNPDLLEQRIGRLDRIGQTETIQLHVPYLENSAQEIMQQWYHQGLSAFEHTCPAGHSVFVQVRATLLEALHQLETKPEELMALIATTQQLYNEMNDRLQRGRDRLLEYNSCRPLIANNLKALALAEDENNDLADYLEHLYDCYGVDMEEHGEQSFLISQGERMQHAFPGLHEEGMVITCDRATALANEDMHYITWEHPMVRGAMEMVLTNELGNSTITTLKARGFKAGNLLLEGIYVLESSASSELNLSRYLPPTTIRVVIDQSGKDQSHLLSSELIREGSAKVDKATAGKIIRAYAEPLRNMIVSADKLARQQAPELLGSAHQQTRQTLEREINRLEALRKVNPNVRDEEIQFFAEQWKTLDLVLEAASPRLDAVRIIITT